jgi:hypothetical protein
MLRFFRQMLFEPLIKPITGLSRIFYFLSCRATARHLKILMIVQGSIDFSLSLEVISHETVPSLNPTNQQFPCLDSSAKYEKSLWNRIKSEPTFSMLLVKLP